MRAKFRLTREGKFFVGVTIGVGFAAVNTGNNLLYLVLGLMLSLMLFSGVLSDLSMWYLTVKRSFPQRIFANTQTSIRTEVFNRKRRVPSFSLELYQPDGGLDAEQREVESAFFLRVGAKQTEAEHLPFTPLRRGQYPAPRLRLRTQYPFGLIEKSRELHEDLTITVFPEIDSGQIDPTLSAAPGYATSSKLGNGEEIAGLREFNDGDDGRRIHWRKTAAWDRLVVKEHHRNAGKSVSLRLGGIPKTVAKEDLVAWEHSAERTISKLAGQAFAAHENGATVEVIAGATSKVVSADESMDKLLYLLAVHSPYHTATATPTFKNVFEFEIAVPTKEDRAKIQRARKRKWWHRK